MVVLGFLEFASVVKGFTEIVVDEEFSLLTFGLPGVLQCLFVEEDGFSIELELLGNETER
jgi:hypothetical protein